MYVRLNGWILIFKSMPISPLRSEFPLFSCNSSPHEKFQIHISFIPILHSRCTQWLHVAVTRMTATQQHSKTQSIQSECRRFLNSTRGLNGHTNLLLDKPKWWAFHFVRSALHNISLPLTDRFTRIFALSSRPPRAHSYNVFRCVSNSFLCHIHLNDSAQKPKLLFRSLNPHIVREWIQTNRVHVVENHV